MDDMTKEQHLLDDIEDAQLSLRLYKRSVRLVILLASLCLALIVLGIYVGAEGTIRHEDTGGWAAMLIVPGILGTIAAGIIGTAVISSDVTQTKNHPELKLRKALRAHRNHVMRQVQ